MPGDTTEVMKQTKMEPDLARKYKAQAALNDKRIKDLHADAIEHFLRHRAGLTKSGQRIPYLVSHDDEGAREVNVTLPFGIMKKAVTAAEEDGVSARRLLYTALLFYADTRLK